MSFLSGSQPTSPDQPANGGSNLTQVLLSVAAACAGATAFGYHLGVVNGPLEAISADLGVAGDAAMQGLVGAYLLVRNCDSLSFCYHNN